MNNHPTEYRREIDGLRALAVGMVVLYHAFPTFFPGGYIGVDVFFFLSGYLITGNLIRDLSLNRYSLLDFYARRVRRIFPSLLLVISIVLFFGWFLLGPYDFRELGKHGAAGAAFVANILLYKQAGYFAAPSDLKPFLHLWSLAVEEQYYVFWPILLALFWRARSFLPLLFAGVIILSFGANIYYFERNNSATFFLLPFRFWQLAIGGAWAYAEFQGIKISPQKSLWNFLGLAAIATLFFACFALNKNTLYPGWWALLPALAPFFLLAPRFNTFWSAIFQNRLLVFFGLISYPLYLWHWPLLSFARIRLDSEPTIAIRLLLVAIAILLSWLSWRLIETPLRLRFSLQNKKEKFVLVGSGGALALFIFVFGWQIKNRNIEPYLKNKNPIRYELERYAEYDNSDTRLWKCFYESSTEFVGFSPDCYQENGKPKLLLLGDSHAAHLYPGLNKVLSDWNIVQWNTSKCPPFPDLNAKDYLPNCLLAYEDIFAKVKNLDFQLVVIQARWSIYFDQPNFIADLKRTVKILEQGGAKVIVLGASPTWIKAVPRQLILQFVEKNQPLPNFVPEEPEQIAWEADTLLANSLPHGQYLSLLQHYCKNKQCPVYAKDSSDLFVYDDSHLSRAGAEQVSRDLLVPLVQSLKRKKSSNLP